MKKILILITMIFLLSGCSTKVELEGKITEIKYDDIIILEEDYDSVKNLINTSFQSGKDKNLPNKLTIKTEKDIYYYSLSDEYLENNGYYAKNEKIGPFLKKLKDKYHDTNFYSIEYIKNYELKENENNILLDKTSNFIVIKFDEKVKNFKINALESIDDKHKDVDLLYNKDILDKGTIVIRKSISYGKPDIRISFENPYHYNISIIPTYDEFDEDVKFNTTYKTNKNTQ